ncbi:MAG: Uma2 family endonuclease [Cytophagales bacterium]
MVTNTLVEADFLTFERNSDTKHELIFNELIEMSGASFKHTKIVRNLLVIFSNLFETHSVEFQAISNDLRVTNPLNDSYCYPDIVVIEGEPQFIDTEFDTLLNPVMIVEVLSNSTEKRDQIEKFEIYKSIPSIKEYIIVAQQKPFIKHYKKLALNHWEFFEYNQLNESISALDNKFTIKIEDIYDKCF